MYGSVLKLKHFVSENITNSDFNTNIRLFFQTTSQVKVQIHIFAENLDQSGRPAYFPLNTEKLGNF